MIQQAKPLIFALATLALVVSGCQVPNIEPFAHATFELRRAVIEGGAVTSETMAAMPPMPTDTIPKEAAGQFVAVWQERVQLMDVLLGYSDALAGIAAAGTGAQQTAAALGDSISQLATLVPTTGAAVEAGVQLGQILVQTGIQIQSYRNLAQAIGAAHPALTEVAMYLEADLDDLRRLYLNASQTLEGALDESFGKRESQRQWLLAKRDEFRDTMVRTFNDSKAKQVKKIEELLVYMEPDHQQYVQLREVLLQQRSATLQMFEQAKQGVHAWVQAHQELLLAIEQNRRPNVRLLLGTAQDLKEAVDRIQNRT
jgi:hypothetical protein